MQGKSCFIKITGYLEREIVAPLALCEFRRRGERCFQPERKHLRGRPPHLFFSRDDASGFHRFFQFLRLTGCTSPDDIIFPRAFFCTRLWLWAWIRSRRPPSLPPSGSLLPLPNHLVCCQLDCLSFPSAPPRFFFLIIPRFLVVPATPFCRFRFRRPSRFEQRDRIGNDVSFPPPLFSLSVACSPPSSDLPSRTPRYRSAMLSLRSPRLESDIAD